MDHGSPGHDSSRNDDPRSGAGAANIGGWIAFILLLMALAKACSQT